MVQETAEDPMFRPIEEYEQALTSFKEPEKPLKSPKNFTMHTDPRIEEYFKYVAKQGRTELEWAKVRGAFLWKLKAVIEDMREKTTEDKLIPGRDDERNLKQTFDFIIARAESFEDAPFTFQRICELLLTPDRHYNSVGKYLRALEKTINVNTCVLPSGDRITNADEMEPEEPLDDEGVENAFIDVRVDELEMDGSLLDGKLKLERSVIDQNASNTVVSGAKTT